MIIGHEKQRQFLINSVKLKRVAHAYLFKGEEYLGKKRVALEFLKIINCQSSDIDQRPCQLCLACQDFDQMVNPDLFFIEPDPTEIKLGQIRDLIKKISLKPYKLKYKMIIIDQAEKLNQEASNALLKTLEEPSKNSIFILISAYPDLLPMTILSRMQIVNFFPIDQEELKNFIKKNLNQKLKNKDIVFSNNEIKDLLFFSDGKPEKMIYFLDHQEAFDQVRKNFQIMTQLLKSDLIYAFEYVKSIVPSNKNKKNNNNQGFVEEVLVKDQEMIDVRKNKGLARRTKEPVEQFLDHLLIYFRSLLLKAGKKNTDRYSLEEIARMIHHIQRARFFIQTTNVDLKLILENLLLKLLIKN